MTNIKSESFKCIVFDHDDTLVNSTAEIHYPAYLSVMKLLRPQTEPVSLETWFEKNFNPGVISYYRDELNFTDKELHLEHRFWLEYIQNSHAELYDGIRELLEQYSNRGGIIAIVSHGDRDFILKDLIRLGIDTFVSEIFGWDHDPERRKPAPYPLKTIMNKYKFKAEEVLVIDDLQWGIRMAEAVGAHSAAAGWGHDIKKIKDHMQANCNYYFSSVSQLLNFLDTVCWKDGIFPAK